MIITDEMVEKAEACFNDNTCNFTNELRAALEAVAPMLIAQGMREAVNLIGNYGEAHKGEFCGSHHILARAQELDPK